MPSLYVDSSALVKLFADEPESDALRAALAGRRLVSSVLAEIEVRRAGRRHGLADSAAAAMRAVVLLSLEQDVVEAAVSAQPETLASLDAIHLASALTLGEEVDALVTYDERLADAAGAAGLTVLAPR